MDSLFLVDTNAEGLMIKLVVTKQMTASKLKNISYHIVSITPTDKNISFDNLKFDKGD